MQKDDNRDRWVEPMLRQTMNQPLTPPDSSSCLDGETIAAWAERTLRPAEAEHVERHLSECARCSTLLATLVRTAPEITTSGRFWHLRWLVPAATAATVVAIWFAVPGNRTVPARNDSATQIAKLESRSASTEAGPKGPALQESPAASPAASAPPESRVAPAPGASAGRQAGFIESSAASRAREQVEKRVDAIAATPTPRTEPPLTQADALPDREPTRDVAAREASVAKADEKRANAIEPQAPQVAAATPAPAPVQGSAPAATRAAAGARTLNARLANVAIEVPSPSPANRWRITNGRSVERSTTSGATWEAVSIPKAEGLLGGFSPAPSICWLVGRAGTILITTDGVRFSRVAFPETLDLVSVRANDDQQATVTAADGRSFRTSDRGVTWTRNE